RPLRSVPARTAGQARLEENSDQGRSRQQNRHLTQLVAMAAPRRPKLEQTAAAPQWGCTLLAAGRARGLAGKATASLEPRACAPCPPRQGCALRAGLRPPLTRRARRSDIDRHRQPGDRKNQPHGGSDALISTPTTTLQAYAAPPPDRRPRSPKRSVTMPNAPVTIDRNPRSRWTETTGHVRRNTQNPRLGSDVHGGHSAVRGSWRTTH